MFCTNCHKIDITTGYLQLGGNTSIHEKAILEVEFSVLMTPDIQLCFIGTTDR